MRAIFAQPRIALTRRAVDCQSAGVCVGRMAGATIGRACLLTVLVIAGCAPNIVRSSGSATPSIAQARQERASTIVTVEGIVTVASDTFDDGFAIADASGGVYVFDSLGTHYELGDHVRVDGILAARNDELGIRPSAIDRVGTATVPQTVDVTSGSVGAAQVGRLVRVHGRVQGELVDDWPYGWKMYLDDGSGAALVFISMSTGIHIDPLRNAPEITASGYCGRYKDHYEILPRTQDDLRPAD